MREAHAPQRASAGDPLKICMLLSKELCTVFGLLSGSSYTSGSNFGAIVAKFGMKKYFGVGHKLTSSDF